MHLSVTSGGIEIGVPPIRDRAEEVAEKHLVWNGCESAGTRKLGRELVRDGSRRSCRRQRIDAVRVMGRCALLKLSEQPEKYQKYCVVGQYPPLRSRDFLLD